MFISALDIFKNGNGPSASHTMEPMAAARILGEFRNAQPPQNTKAASAASLELRGDGQHVVPLDNCIETLRQTGIDMNSKHKETTTGGWP